MIGGENETILYVEQGYADRMFAHWSGIAHYGFQVFDMGFKHWACDESLKYDANCYKYIL